MEIIYLLQVETASFRVAQVFPSRLWDFSAKRWVSLAKSGAGGAVTVSMGEASVAVQQAQNLRKAMADENQPNVLLDLRISPCKRRFLLEPSFVGYMLDFAGCNKDLYPIWKYSMIVDKQK